MTTQFGDRKSRETPTLTKAVLAALAALLVGTAVPSWWSPQSRRAPGPSFSARSGGEHPPVDNHKDDRERTLFNRINTPKKMPWRWWAIALAAALCAGGLLRYVLE